MTSRETYCIHQAIAPLLISYRALKGQLLTKETVHELEERMTTTTAQDLEIGQIDGPAMPFKAQNTECFGEHKPKENVSNAAKHAPKRVDATASA
jgi:hypothetical protein